MGLIILKHPRRRRLRTLVTGLAVRFRFYFGVLFSIYTLPDFVYVELSSQSPYQICKIEELIKVFLSKICIVG